MSIRQPRLCTHGHWGLHCRRPITNVIIYHASGNRYGMCYACALDAETRARLSADPRDHECSVETATEAEMYYPEMAEAVREEEPQIHLPLDAAPPRA